MKKPARRPGRPREGLTPGKYIRWTPEISAAIAAYQKREHLATEVEATRQLMVKALRAEGLLK
jgi:hypothetical protein